MQNVSNYLKAVLFVLPCSILWFQVVALVTEAYYGDTIELGEFGEVVIDGGGADLGEYVDVNEVRFWDSCTVWLPLACTV